MFLEIRCQIYLWFKCICFLVDNFFLRKNIFLLSFFLNNFTSFWTIVCFLLIKEKFCLFRRCLDSHFYVMFHTETMDFAFWELALSLGSLHPYQLWWLWLVYKIICSWPCASWTSTKASIWMSSLQLHSDCLKGI